MTQISERKRSKGPCPCGKDNFEHMDLINDNKYRISKGNFAHGSQGKVRNFEQFIFFENFLILFFLNYYKTSPEFQILIHPGATPVRKYAFRICFPSPVGQFLLTGTIIIPLGKIFYK
jgi:hypothetical protein